MSDTLVKLCLWIAINIKHSDIYTKTHFTSPNVVILYYTLVSYVYLELIELF